MEFPQEKVIKVNGIKITVTPYLTTTMISAILNAVIEYSDYATRCATADCMVIRYCTDIEEFNNDEVSLDLYDMCKANGIVDAITREISGYDILLSGLADLSVKDIYRTFEENMKVFTKEFENINLDEQQKKLTDTLEELKKVEAEKEAILNG